MLPRYPPEGATYPQQQTATSLKKQPLAVVRCSGLSARFASYLQPGDLGFGGSESGGQGRGVAQGSGRDSVHQVLNLAFEFLYSALIDLRAASLQPAAHLPRDVLDDRRLAEVILNLCEQQPLDETAANVQPVSRLEHARPLIHDAQA